MIVTVITSCRCDKCNEIIWTQTDNREGRYHRPSLTCQCYCGETKLTDTGITQGGKGEFTEEELLAAVKEAHSYEPDGIKVLING